MTHGQQVLSYQAGYLLRPSLSCNERNLTALCPLIFVLFVPLFLFIHLFGSLHVHDTEGSELGRIN